MQSLDIPHEYLASQGGQRRGYYEEPGLGRQTSQPACKSLVSTAPEVEWAAPSYCPPQRYLDRRNFAAAIMPAPGQDLDAKGFPTATNTVEFGFEDGPATGGRRKKAEKQAKKAKPGSFGKQQ